MAKWIAIDDIRADGGTQTRAELRPDVIEEYAEAMRRGDEFPPIDVFLDRDGHHWLADGFHRFNAAASAELSQLKANVHKGELRDAIWFALSVNATNGLRRTNPDKRRCVTIALSDKEWQAKTDQALADHLGVTQQYVNRIRNELTTVVSSHNGQSTRRKKGKDGKSRPATYKPRATKTAAPPTNGKAVAVKPTPPPTDEAEHREPEPAHDEVAPNSQRKPEPNTIGALKERFDAFLEQLIDGQPAHVVAVLKDHILEVAGAL